MHFSKTDTLLYSTRKNTVTSPFPLGHLLIKNGGGGGGGGNRAGIRLRLCTIDARSPDGMSRPCFRFIMRAKSAAGGDVCNPLICSQHFAPPAFFLSRPNLSYSPSQPFLLPVQPPPNLSSSPLTFLTPPPNLSYSPS
jgi:hypothetical protein